jgi:DNA adenine methylase
MLYLGGKDRIANRIARAILDSTPKRHSYLEPFFGGGSSFLRLAPHFKETRAGDLHADLIAMWHAAQDGFRFPRTISEQEYREYKRTKSPHPLKGFAGFATSFGGKWFGGYARNAQAKNYAEPQADSVEKIGYLLGRKQTMVCHASYEAWNAKDYVVYADPPYAGTTSYKVKEFDSSRFWKTMDSWVEGGASVFVSEYNAPAHWKCILRIELDCLVEGFGGNGTRVERLFTR